MLREIFGPDPEANQRRWTRSTANPIIRSTGAGWAADLIAPCSVVEWEGRLRLYVEGSRADHEQIGLFTTRSAARELDQWAPSTANPVLRVGDGFDRGGVFDPAVVRFEGRWLLFYSATEGDAHAFAAQWAQDAAACEPRDEKIGLATSDDGEVFTKYPGAPVLSARCPFAFVHEGQVYLFHVRVHAGGYRIHLAVSDDGISFRPARDEPILDVGEPGSWDSFSVTTPKVFRDGDGFCLSFAGDNTSLDDPIGIGLAFSDDLISWDKAPGNPIFTTGAPGSFDSASVASPIIRRVADSYHMWYGGSDRAIEDGLHSQVGMASIVATY
jgi:predicted GH43/DUF377 family glycosyl hydrolase